MARSATLLASTLVRQSPGQLIFQQNSEGVLFKLLKSRWILAALALCVLVGATGIWALLHPGGIWLQHWRAEPSVVSSRFIFGPYPLEDDFTALKAKGVSTIISLLDPSLPYEKILLAQERVLAEQHGMRVLNFPMASILGQSFGKDYVANSKTAAQAAIDSEGVAYIHCYLGLHRSKYVQKFLEDYAATAIYQGTLQSGRSDDVLALVRSGGGEKYEDYDYYPAEWKDVHRDRRRGVGWSLYSLVGIPKGDRVASAKQAARNFLFFDAPVGVFVTTDSYLGRGSWSDAGMYLQTIMLAAKGFGMDTCPGSLDPVSKAGLQASRHPGGPVAGLWHGARVRRSYEDREHAGERARGFGQRRPLSRV